MDLIGAPNGASVPLPTEFATNLELMTWYIALLPSAVYNCLFVLIINLRTFSCRNSHRLSAKVISYKDVYFSSELYAPGITIATWSIYFILSVPDGCSANCLCCPKLSWAAHLVMVACGLMMLVTLLPNVCLFVIGIQHPSVRSCPPSLSQMNICRATCFYHCSAPHAPILDTEGIMGLPLPPLFKNLPCST